MTKENWIIAEKQDPVLNQLITLLKSKTLGHRKHHKNDSPELKSMLRIKKSVDPAERIVIQENEEGKSGR